MTMKTPLVAKECYCPVSSVREHCRTGLCIMWRWEPLLTSEPGYKDALQKANAMDKLQRDGKTAAEYVNANLDQFGLPERPYQGWCGLAGKPEVRTIE